jgi:hypothetical protein
MPALKKKCRTPVQYYNAERQHSTIMPALKNKSQTPVQYYNAALKKKGRTPLSVF